LIALLDRLSLRILSLVAGILLVGGGAPSAVAFSLNGYSWPSGTEIEMYLNLERPATSFQDESQSWNASAFDAMLTWNQYLTGVTFVQRVPVPFTPLHYNIVSFSNTINTFPWPKGVLALTLTTSDANTGTYTQTNVVFNNTLKWDSYRGPIQGSGENATYDFHRVALHEFGHVLGLDHPDEHSQNVVALMNSGTSDLDHLSDDDIAGVQAIYGNRKVTSALNPPAVNSGDLFSYQITANNQPSSYSAVGLPAGLQLDGASGLISGHCPTSGTFAIDLTVQGAAGPAFGRLFIKITPYPIQSNKSADVQVGFDFSYQILSSNGASTYGATGLPAGLQVNTASGLISGVPQVSGNYVVHVVARSATNEAAADIQLFVLPPRITSTQPPSVNLGDPLSYQITATNPVNSFSAAGLPPGVQIHSSSGLISGTPTSSGQFIATVTVQTAYGAATSQIYFVVNAPAITSLVPADQDVGTTYNYQITATNHPYLFTATGLPPGLVLDETTGKISGVAELSGQYEITLSAVGAVGTAKITWTITVSPSEVADPPLKKISLTVWGKMVADPVRPRLYVPTANSLMVIDTNSFSVIKTIPINSAYLYLTVSIDGSKLWVTGYAQSTISVLDLNSLTITKTISVPSRYPLMVREGADGYLYASDFNQSDVAQIDPATGAVLAHFTATNQFGAPAIIDVSPDHTKLYVSSFTGNTPIAIYNISPGNPPTLLQRVETSNQTNCYKIAVHPGGESIAVMTSKFGNSVEPTLVRSTSDLNLVQRSFLSPAAPSNMLYSFDGALFFQAMQRSRIDVFNAANGLLARTITLPDNAIPAHDSNTTQSLAVDSTNSYLFVASSAVSAPGALYVYSLAPPPPKVTPPKSLLNIATRMRSQGGDSALIGGFIVTGNGPKQLALRALGPSLPVAGKLADPVLQLFDSTGALVAQNDNWNAHRADVIATGIPPLDEHEATIATTLQPGSYTAVVRGVNGSTGVALVEAYDLSPDSGSKLANISTRGKVETGDNVMIGGFILGGDQVTNVCARAIGPSLANFGVAGALSNPWLEVYNGNGALLAQDDDWRMYQEQALIASGLAPSDDRESALLMTLQPGAYTAIVRGKNESTGVSLVEVYNLDSN